MNYLKTKIELQFEAGIASLVMIKNASYAFPSAWSLFGMFKAFSVEHGSLVNIWNIKTAFFWLANTHLFCWHICQKYTLHECVIHIVHLRLQNYFQTKYFSVILYKLWPWEHFLHCTQFAVGPGANVQMDLQTAPGLKKPGSSQTKSCTISFKFPAFAGSDKRGWWREATGRDCLSKPHLTWARLGLPALLHLLSQFDVHHPPLQFILHILKGSSLPSRFCFMLTRMHVFAIVYNDVQKKGMERWWGKIWQLFHDDRKNEGGEIRHSFSCCLIAAKPAKSRFSINFTCFCLL